MITAYKDKLEILRQRLPIGLRHGLAILEKTDGDVEKAVDLFKQETLLLVISQTGVTEDLAIKHLIKTNFEINATFKSIDEERYSLTERILKRYKNNKEEALGVVLDTVKKEHKIIERFCLDFEHLPNLSPEVYCVFTVINWLHYNDYEGFDYAIYEHLDLITDQIEKQLLLPEIAKTMRKAEEIKRKTIGRTLEFNEQWDLFNTQKTILFDTLYEFVEKHIDKFP